MMKLKKNGYPYFMIDFEAKAAAQNFALVLKTAEWEGPLPADCVEKLRCRPVSPMIHFLS